ncbi:MAG TPA: hypothetical protein PK198_09085, partial [Saprospiraceae bacterium]|nr:hypothetical protein [Saprospiraceae bacterium]
PDRPPPTRKKSLSVPSEPAGFLFAPLYLAGKCYISRKISSAFITKPSTTGSALQSLAPLHSSTVSGAR